MINGNLFGFIVGASALFLAYALSYGFILSKSIISNSEECDD